MQMIFHSKPIAIVLLVDMVALLMYNFSGMCVTGEGSSHSSVMLAAHSHAWPFCLNPAVLLSIKKGYNLKGEKVIAENGK